MDLNEILGINQELKKKQIALFEEINTLKETHKNILEKDDSFSKHVIFQYPNQDSKTVWLGFNDHHLPVLPQYIKDEILILFYKYFPKI